MPLNTHDLFAIVRFLLRAFGYLQLRLPFPCLENIRRFLVDPRLQTLVVFEFQVRRHDES